jgi:hypothetical protein
VPGAVQLSASGGGAGTLVLSPAAAAEAAAVQALVVTGVIVLAVAMAGAGISLLPYSRGGGHHVPAKKVFENDPNYNPGKAPALPKEALKQMGGGGPKAGGQVHTVISRAQRFLYQDFLSTGQPLTWQAVAKIETQALVECGVDSATARATVNAAIAELQAMGVAENSMLIPWGG